MERDEVLKRVEEIFREELGQSDIELYDEATAEDVEGWDSLSHVQLVAAIENVFGIESRPDPLEEYTALEEKLQKECDEVFSRLKIEN